MATDSWRFFIDVGGTFTDVVARRPDGAVVTFKLLSSGVIRGTLTAPTRGACIVDAARTADPPGFWKGYRLRWTDGQVGDRSHLVSGSDAASGTLTLNRPPEPGIAPPAAYELSAHEPAPVLAIRYLMGLPLEAPIGAVEVRLGTTRATNALLERKGARVALVTTRGHGDILRIGHQARPSLFELHIRKREELTAAVLEIDERLAADGGVLRPVDEAAAHAPLIALRDNGIEVLAVCFLHAHRNPAHEEILEEAARRAGFEHVRLSSQVSRVEGMVSRADTTVADAYLDPVIRGYVESLRRSLPEARLRLMTSAGGLMDAATVSGKDTILSGPAGGVVGCARVAREAGLQRAIGFDMGGTSTDVCRIDPSPQGMEYQFETVKAGVRLAVPMLAVETVAAGGGSLCTFDGQKLAVGPHSAGADPGPACYGRGGPLTLTDVNLFLGRVVPDFFPFPLNASVVRDHLQAVVDAAGRAGHATLTPVALAEGFVRIANDNMAAAIRRISLAKGYDVRDYGLVTFGGAGGQHACAIARTLGMRQVLISPFAGVLSAVGIGSADVKRIVQRGIDITLRGDFAARLAPVLAGLTAEVRSLLHEEGVASDEAVQLTATLDLCYAGQATRLTVPANPIDGVAAAFEDLHRQLYGYTHEGRAIEARVARIEGCITAPPLPLDGPLPAPGDELSADEPARTDRTTTMIIDGRPRTVPLRLGSELRPGSTLEGPAIIIEDTSTVVVDPGWQAKVLDHGELLLTDLQGSTMDAGSASPDDASTAVDPIRLELFNNRFAAIAEQMGTTLRRTALSTNVKERLDYSCALFTRDGDLVVNAPHIPVHLGGMSDCVRCLIEDVKEFHPGDAYVTNDPYRGGSHLNDVTVVTPVHDPDGRDLLFFVASRAHHAEIGGTRPGSMPPDSTTLAEEGVLIRAFPWMRNGQSRHDALRTLLTAPPHPSRSPDENLADVSAQAAANRTGLHALHALLQQHGLPVVSAYMGHIQAAAERIMRSALARIPDGVHRFEDQLDDGWPIRLALTIRGDGATLDFTGTGPVHPGNLNANRAIVTSAVLYCLRCLLAEDIPLNAGVLAPIEIILPECFLHPPAHADPAQCRAVVGGNVETSQRIVDVIFGALRCVSASQGTMNNLLMGNERFGYYETICGGAGAGPTFDGADAVHTNMTNTRLTDPEVFESRYPVRLVRFAIRHGSGGDGRHRGGCGAIREIEFLTPLDVSIISQRRTVAPYGLEGGLPGSRGRNLLRRAGENVDTELPPIAHLSVHPGDRLTIETPGGGGYGRPEGRE